MSGTGNPRSLSNFESVENIEKCPADGPEIESTANFQEKGSLHGRVRQIIAKVRPANNDRAFRGNSRQALPSVCAHDRALLPGRRARERERKKKIETLLPSKN